MGAAPMRWPRASSAPQAQSAFSRSRCAPIPPPARFSVALDPVPSRSGATMTIRRRRVRPWGFAIVCLTVSGRLFAQPAGLSAPTLPSNHALIITVSEYQRSPLPGVLTDRKLANELARRFGVPTENIVELSEQQVTREGLKQALASMNQAVLPGDKLYVYFSEPRARYFSTPPRHDMESTSTQPMPPVTN